MYMWASQAVLVIKNPPSNAGATRNLGSIPGWGRFPGGCMAAFLPGESLWTEEPGGLQSMGSQKVRHD